MDIKKKILSSVVSASIMLSANVPVTAGLGTVAAADENEVNIKTSEDGLWTYYEINGDAGPDDIGVCVVSYLGNDEEVEINEVDGKGVWWLENGAFAGSHVKKLTVPPYLWFKGFEGLESLEEYEVSTPEESGPDDRMYVIDGVLYRTDTTMEWNEEEEKDVEVLHNFLMNYPDAKGETYVIPSEFDNGLDLIIGERAFAGSNIKTITIPEGTVVQWWSSVFEDCELEKVIYEGEGNDWLRMLDDGNYVGDNDCLRNVPTECKKPSTVEHNMSGDRFMLYDDKGNPIGEDEDRTTECQLTWMHYYGEKIELPEKIWCNVDKTEENPEGREKRTLTEIGNWIFSNREGVKEIVVPASVKYIPENCFENCVDLEKITFLSDEVYLSDTAFRECTKLKEVVTHEGAIKSVGAYAFENCSSLKSIDLSGATWLGRRDEGMDDEGNPWTNWDGNVFDGCASLKEVTLADGLEVIPDRCFLNSGIEKLVIPASVSDIRWMAIGQCPSLKKITVAEGNEAYAATDDELMSIRSWFDKGEYGEDKPAGFYPNKILIKYFGNDETYTLKNNEISWVESNAFVDCVNLSAIELEEQDSYGFNVYDGVLYQMDFELGDEGEITSRTPRELICYPRAKAGKSYTVKDGTKGINNYSFYGAQIESITLPGSIDRIDNAFEMSQLKSLDVPAVEGFDHLGYGFFSNCPNLESVTIPDTITSMEDSIFEGCVSLKEVTLPSNLTRLGFGFFRNCTSLESVELPAKIEEIDEAAFENCTALTTINIPDALRTIRRGAFANCSSLTGPLNLSKVTSIGSEYDDDNWGGDVFRDCASLTKVTLSDDIWCIPEFTFANCVSLEEVNIPTNIATIGHGAFQNCQKLKSADLNKANLGLIGDNSFEMCQSLTAITIPATIERVGAWTFQNCKSLKNVTISEGVKSIGDGAFGGESSIETITIPSTMREIDNFAFGANSSLKTIVIKAPEAKGTDEDHLWIGNIANECESFEAFIFDGSEKDWDKVYKHGEWNNNWRFDELRNDEDEVIAEDDRVPLHFDSSVQHKITGKKDRDANCTDDESWIFECTCGVKFRKSVPNTAKGHTYGDLDFDFVDGDTACIATVMCADPDCNKGLGYVVTEISKNISVEEVEPTCGENGYTLITASFEKEPFIGGGEMTTDVVSATGKHTYAEADDAVPATCGKDGKKASKICAVCGDKVPGDARPATDEHKADSKVTYSFSKDHKSCTATAKCSVCGNDITAEAKSVTNASANGKITYTATFDKYGIAAGTETVDDPDASTSTGDTSASTSDAGTSAPDTSAPDTSASESGAGTSAPDASDVSDTSTPSSDDSKQLDAPKSFAVTKNGTTSITLGWKKVTGATGYTIQQKNGKSWKTITTINKGATVTATIKKLKAGTAYDFRICANGKNASKYTTLTAVTQPTKVAGFKASKKKKTSITLKWKKNSTAKGYQLQQKVGKKWKTIGTITKNGTVKGTIKKLKKNTSYQFRIRAYVTNGKTKVFGAAATVKAKTTKKYAHKKIKK